MDIRYVYLLRMKRGKIKCLMAVKIPFAEKRESRLHDMFDRRQFTMTQDGKSGYKIGITNKIERRLGTIRADRLSGKTEWFRLSFLMAWCVRFWVLHWAFWWFTIRLAIIILLA